MTTGPRRPLAPCKRPCHFSSAVGCSHCSGGLRLKLRYQDGEDDEAAAAKAAKLPHQLPAVRTLMGLDAGPGLLRGHARARRYSVTRMLLTAIPGQFPPQRVSDGAGEGFGALAAWCLWPGPGKSGWDLRRRAPDFTIRPEIRRLIGSKHGVLAAVRGSTIAKIMGRNSCTCHLRNMCGLAGKLTFPRHHVAACRQT